MTYNESRQIDLVRAFTVAWAAIDQLRTMCDAKDETVSIMINMIYDSAELANKEIKIIQHSLEAE